MSVSDLIGGMADDRPAQSGDMPASMDPPGFPHLAHINGQRGSTPETDGFGPPAPRAPDGAPVTLAAKQQMVADALAAANMVDSLDVEFAIKSREGKENGSGDAPDDSYVRDLVSATSNEVFGDEDLDFLANAGSANMTDSELARQSLYQKFDPFVPAAGVPVAPKAPPRPADAVFKQPFPVHGSTATTDMIAAMQHKRDAIMKQQTASEGKPVQFGGLELAQPHSWPDERNNNTTAMTAPFANLKSSPKATPPMSQPRHQTQTLDNPVNGEHGDYLLNGDGALSVEEESAEQPIPAYDAYPPGSLVNFATPPQRPVTLRAKNTTRMSSINKTMHRRSVPASVFAERENLKMAMDAEQQGGDYAGLPDLPPMWENVVAMYEGVVQTLLAKLKTFQEETAAAKQREARAIADQEEMHRVFVGLHERFETSKTVITTYKSNQEVLQKAFDELNADFAPMQQEMKRLQAANRLNEMKVRQLENELEKKREENAEMNKIVEELISGSKDG